MTRFRFAALAVLAVFPSVAAAGPVLDARIDGAVTGEAAPQLGTGVGALLGLPIDLGPIELVPEAGATFWLGDGLIVLHAGALTLGGPALPTTTSLVAGVRLGIAF